MRILPCLCLLLVSGCMSSSGLQFGSIKTWTPDLQPLPLRRHPSEDHAHTLLRRAAARAGFRLEIDASCPNPVVATPGYLWFMSMQELYDSEPGRYPNRDFLQLHRRLDRDPTLSRTSIESVCASAGLTFQAEGTRFVVAPATGRQLSQHIRQGLRDTRYDALWMDATPRAAADDLCRLFPYVLIDHEWPVEEADPEYGPATIHHCGLDLHDWQVIELLAAKLYFAVDYRNDGRVVLTAMTEEEIDDLPYPWPACDSVTGEIVRR